MGLRRNKKDMDLSSDPDPLDRAANDIERLSRPEDAPDYNPLTGMRRGQTGPGSAPPLTLRPPKLQDRLLATQIKNQSQGEFRNTGGAAVNTTINNMQKPQTLRRNAQFDTADRESHTNDLYQRMGSLQTGRFGLDAPSDVVRSTPGGRYETVRPAGLEGDGHGVGNLAMGQGKAFNKQRAEKYTDASEEAPQSFLDTGLSRKVTGEDGKEKIEGLTRKDVVRHMNTEKANGRKLTYDQAVQEMAGRSLQQRKETEQFEQDKRTNKLLVDKGEAEIVEINHRVKQAEASLDMMVKAGMAKTPAEAAIKMTAAMIMSPDPPQQAAGFSLLGRSLIAGAPNAAAKDMLGLRIEFASGIAKVIRDLDLQKITPSGKWADMPSEERLAAIEKLQAEKRAELLKAMADLNEYYGQLNDPGGVAPAGGTAPPAGTTSPGGSPSPKTEAPPKTGGASSSAAPTQKAPGPQGAPSRKEVFSLTIPKPMTRDHETGKLSLVPGQIYRDFHGKLWKLAPDSDPAQPKIIPAEQK